MVVKRSLWFYFCNFAPKLEFLAIMNNMPPVTKNLLIINVLFFAATWVAALPAYGIDLNDVLGLHFLLAGDFRFYQIFTYMFMHGSFSHLFFNMFAVWMFGRIMEQTMGSKRFLFYYLDKKTEWIDVLDEGDGEPLDEFFEKLGKEYLAFFHTLQELPEIKFQMTPEQGVAFNKHFALLQADYVGLFGDDTVASVRRLATSTYRIAMILSALRIWEDGDTESPRICSDEDYQTAMAISEVLQQHMLRVIKELPSSTSKVATGQAKEPLLLKAFWDALPEEFEAKDFKAIAQEVGLSIPTAERYIRQWVDTRLDKVSRGRYRKR